MQKAHKNRKSPRNTLNIDSAKKSGCNGYLCDVPKIKFQQTVTRI